jgi:hypothetical protein
VCVCVCVCVCVGVCGSDGGLDVQCSIKSSLEWNLCDHHTRELRPESRRGPDLHGSRERQGKYEEAKETHERALEGYEKVLEVEHPSILAIANNLAEIL